MAQVRRTPAIADVQVEQRKAVDGLAVARVHVFLTRPADYRVRSTRNTIRLDLAPAASRGTRFDVPAPPAPMKKSVAAPAATVLERVRTQVGAATTITLSGNGHLTPSTVVEAQDLPRRLVMDFKKVGSRAPAQTAVQGSTSAACASASTATTRSSRVVMEIADGVHYRVDRAGESAADVAVVFSPRR